MNLGFLHPLFLWGMLGAALPIIIHLINRRRARRVVFSATYFVQLSNKRLARRLKLKQWLLLLFRTLLLLLIPLLLARPHVSERGAKARVTDSAVPATRILVFDRSLSMQARYDGAQLFERARDKARDLTTAFGGQDNFALISAPPSPSAKPMELTFDPGEMLRGIDDLEPSFRATDLLPALDRARLLLESSTLPRKQVILIGDATRNGYASEISLSSGGEPVAVILHDVREGRPVANTAITGFTAEPSFFTGPRDWKLSVQVSNFGSEALAGLPVTVLADGENVAGGFLDIEAGETATKDFIQRFRKNTAMRLEARIPKDALDADNRRRLWLAASENLNALVVNGRPSVTRHLDEIFYIREALNPGDMNRSRIRTTAVTPDWLEQNPLDGFDLVFLCDVPEIKETVGTLLTSFVSDGGGLFIAAGPGLDPDSYNRHLLPLLPGFLRGEHMAGTTSREAGRGAAVHLSRFDYGHSIFRIFSDETAKSLYDAPVRGYLTFDPDARPGKVILARYTDNSPALVEQRVGQGRVMLWTTSVSRSWTDLPIQPGFLPLIQESGRYLAGERRDDDIRNREAGERFRWTGEEEIRSLLDPDGKEIPLEPQGDGASSVGSPPLETPGFYTVKSASGVRLFAVNTPLAESDLRPLSEDLREKLYNVQAGASGGEADPSAGEEFSGILVGLLLLFFAAEVAVLRWMG